MNAYTVEQLQDRDWFAFMDAYNQWREDMLATHWESGVMDWWEELLSAVGLETDRECWTHTADAQNVTVGMDAVWRYEPEWKPLIVTQCLEPELRSALLALGAVLESFEEMHPRSIVVMGAGSHELGCCGFGRESGKIVENTLMEQIILEHAQILLRIFVQMLIDARNECLSESAFIRDASREGWLFDAQGNRIESEQRQAA